MNGLPTPGRPEPWFPLRAGFSDQVHEQAAALRVLLVEDDVDDMMMLSDTLLDASEDDVDIESAFCLETAERLLLQQDFDVVFLDLNLADSGGVETVRGVRKCRRNASIVVVSGVRDPAAEKQCLDEGALAFIGKDSLSRQALEDALQVARGSIRSQ